MAHLASHHSSSEVGFFLSSPILNGGLTYLHSSLDVGSPFTNTVQCVDHVPPVTHLFLCASHPVSSPAI
jgi:hypothetical protein